MNKSSKSQHAVISCAAAPVCKVELLESRCVLAVIFTFTSGTLTFSSNDSLSDDAVIFGKSNPADRQIYYEDAAGEHATNATFDDVKRIIFDNSSGNGSDFIAIDPEDTRVEFDTIPVTMKAGSDGDSFDASSVGRAAVLLIGGSGDDLLVGGGGDRKNTTAFK